jgi:hypothetical protein
MARAGRPSKSRSSSEVVDNEIPPGTTLFTQGVSSGGITGEPTTEGVCSSSRSRSATRPGRRTPVLLDHNPAAAAAGDHQPERRVVAGDPRRVLLLREPLRRRRGAGLHVDVWCPANCHPAANSLRARAGSRALRPRAARSRSQSASPTRAGPSPSVRFRSRSADRDPAPDIVRRRLSPLLVRVIEVRNVLGEGPDLRDLARSQLALPLHGMGAAVERPERCP